MPKPYSEDLRSRVAEAVAAGNTVRGVALQYKVSPAFACKMHALWRETGAVQGKPFGGYKRSRLEPYEAALKVQLTEHPSMTLQEQRDWLKEAYDLETSVSAVARFVRQTGYRYKKKR
jgi:transposase